MSRRAADASREHAPSYTVTELAGVINAALGDAFGDGFWVSGEITGWSARTQHAYFSLIETVDGNKAKIDIKFFAGQRRALRPLLEQHRLELTDGIKIRIFGRLDFYAAGGSLGVIMTDLDPRFTLGEMALAREEVLQRLRASGRFDDNRGRQLSPVPLRLAVVSGVGTAAWHDFADELAASGFGFVVQAHDVRVQGDDAAGEVAAAIGRAARSAVDAIVVIRGGGARTELAVFDDPLIAEAILTSPLPVITGIGHEIDTSIADEVAHTALKTPTATAGFLIDRVARFLMGIEERAGRVEHASQARLDEAHRWLRERADRIARWTHTAVDRADLRLDQRADRVGVAGHRVVDSAFDRTDRIAGRLGEVPRLILERQSAQLDLLAARITAHDPAVLMARGWSIATDTNGAVISSIADVSNGAEVNTRLLDGTIRSTVVATEQQHSSSGDPGPSR